MNILIPIVIIFAIIFIVILQIINKIFIIPENVILIRLISVAVCINLLIFFYLNSSFRIVKNKIGPPGPQGLRGDRGYVGKNKSCNICEPEPNTFGHEKNKELKKTLIIPKKPLLTRLEFNDIENNFYRLNNIFNDEVGCPALIVQNEENAMKLMNKIKETIGKQNPTDEDIKIYLKSHKDKADGNDINRKKANYPKCYGVPYKSL